MIIVIGAMKEELEKINKHKDTLIIQTGVGKVNASMKLTQVLMEHQVDAIYNVGFAGASKHYEIGDVILISDAMYHDFDLTFFGYEKGQVPHYPQKFISNKTIMNQIKRKIEKIKTGSLYTGDYFMTKSVDLPYIVDMEGAALYQVAYAFKIPMVSIKIVSDIVGMDDHYKQYKKFESSVGANLINEIYQKLFKE
ncbi:5'-methylthioadenosine/S-adenosylhomocysteine nucleosidase [Mycoplasmatota bacterium]|nr:5'-methylthioadenosine/S-adenosylhomocysteine nucleosidase [Mycoplasmatota bacterium]